MEKLDLKIARKELFSAPLNRFIPIQVPALTYLIANGHGDPNTAPEYRLAVESLYATAYAIKFACKAKGRDFVVPPLEGLWSAPNPESFTARRKHEWDWTMMIMMPDDVGDEELKPAISASAGKLGQLSATLRLETLHEGLCLQALHLGSYNDEGPLLARLHEEIMPKEGYEFNGRHHEIYLSDPRRSTAEKLKTILRQPVSKD